MTNELLQVKEFQIVEAVKAMIGKKTHLEATPGKPSDVLDAVNKWVAESGVRIVNIESLYRYNSNSSHSHRSDFDGVRVWFAVKGEKASFDSETQLVVLNPGDVASS